MFYCGIDIAKYRHEATVIDQAGAAVQESISFATAKRAARSCWRYSSGWPSPKRGCSSGWKPPVTTG